MRRFSRALVVLVVACGPPPSVVPPPVCFGGGGTGGQGGVGGVTGSGGGFAGGSGGQGGGGPSLDPVGLAGTPLNVGMAFSSFNCPNRTADQVVTEVLDPLNRPVAHTADPVTVDPNNAAATVVHFTPIDPGSYHVTARFEPAVGITQLDVDVAVDKKNAPVVRLTTPNGCDAVEVLSTGLVLCQTQVTHIQLYRASLLLTSELTDVDNFTVAGNVVWTRQAGLVRRYQDLGGSALVEIAGGPLDTGLVGAGTLVALPDQAVLIVASTAVKVHASATALSADPQVPVNLSALEAVHPSADLKELLAFGQGELCRVNFANGGTTDCSLDQKQVVGTDATGLWLSGGLQLEHLSFDPMTPSGALKSETFTLRAVPQNAPFTPHFESAPVLQTTFDGPRRLALVVGSTGLLFEDYAPPAGYLLVPGSAKVARAQSTDGKQLLYTR